ncbi:hypothetical protein AXF14_02685 [Actinomyces radicidentis]|uniref:Uncharacterized protein n=1 Tax=Actinomyces radicidentis TaxID=111015 RepID=A0A120KL99_ACTRD|nr:hypothetical protein AXF14_02685 [Actinomyces radicidentis]
MVAQGAHDALAVVPGVRDDEDAAVAADLLLGAADEPAEELSGDEVASDQGDGVGAPGAQGAGRGIGPVAEAGGDVLDVLTGRLRDARPLGAVERLGDGGDGDARLVGDVADG